jgi:hypothetical protein
MKPLKKSMTSIRQSVKRRHLIRASSVINQSVQLDNELNLSNGSKHISNLIYKITNEHDR